MKFTPRTVRLPDLADTTRSAVSPFILAFDGIIIGRARRYGRRPVGRAILARLAKDVEPVITDQIGHRLHPAITCHPFRLCCGCYVEALDPLGSAALFRAQHQLLDDAYSLVLKLGGYYRTKESLILDL